MTSLKAVACLLLGDMFCSIHIGVESFWVGYMLVRFVTVLLHGVVDVSQARTFVLYDFNLVRDTFHTGEFFCAYDYICSGRLFFDQTSVIIIWVL